MSCLCWIVTGFRLGSPLWIPKRFHFVAFGNEISFFNVICPCRPGLQTALSVSPLTLPCHERRHRIFTPEAPLWENRPRDPIPILPGRRGVRSRVLRGHRAAEAALAAAALPAPAPRGPSSAAAAGPARPRPGIGRALRGPGQAASRARAGRREGAPPPACGRRRGEGEPAARGGTDGRSPSGRGRGDAAPARDGTGRDGAVRSGPPLLTARPTARNEDGPPNERAGRSADPAHIPSPGPMAPGGRVMSAGARRPLRPLGARTSGGPGGGVVLATGRLRRRLAASPRRRRGTRGRVGEEPVPACRTGAARGRGRPAAGLEQGRPGASARLLPPASPLACGLVCAAPGSSFSSCAGDSDAGS